MSARVQVKVITHSTPCKKSACEIHLRINCYLSDYTLQNYNCDSIIETDIVEWTRLPYFILQYKLEDEYILVN
jgi:hypothetical protein